MEKNRKNIVEMEDKLSDASQYGEFVSTFHSWVSSEEQHARAQHLQKLGKKDNRDALL